MLTTVIVIGVLVLAAAVAAKLWLPRLGGPADQVDAFNQARSVTTHWAEDPSSSPRPVLDYLAEQRKPPAEDTQD